MAIRGLLFFTAWLGICAFMLVNYFPAQDESVVLESHDLVQHQKKAKEALNAFENNLPKHIRNMLNPAADPCQNFHQWACGTFEKNAVIPDEKTAWSYSWDTDGTRILKELNGIFEHEQGKAGFYYRACMNTELVEKRGITPVKEWLDLAQNFNDTKSLGSIVAKMHIYEVPVFFSWFLGTDDQDASQNLLYFDKGGLSLPDASFYTDQTKLDQHGPAVIKYLIKSMELAGFPFSLAEKITFDTLKIETEIAGHADDWGDGDNRHTVDSLEEQYPHFGWKEYFAAWGHSDVKGKKIFLTIPAWFKALDGIIAKYPISVLQHYMVAHMVTNVAPLLTQDFIHNSLEMDKDLYGFSGQTPRWKKCTRATRHALPFLASKLFVDKYFPVASQKLATEMLETIRDAFKADLDTVMWMTNETRQAALSKLEGIFFEVGYPPKWPEYGFLVLVNTYFENSMRASEWRSIVKWEQLRHPVERKAWDVTPVNVNAFYYNGVNGVFVPAGILQPPFFDPKESLAHNYGAIGAIMGHELTHGFDGTGALYNAEGKRKDWWDPKTLDEFDTRKQCVVDYYSNYTVLGEHVSGQNTMDEDIADIGGLKMAYKAFLLAEKRRGRVPTLYEKREFWTAFAQTWCGRTRKETEEVNLVTDEHAPDQVRISGAVSQNPDFARDFWCPVGTAMNPVHRCRLW